MTVKCACAETTLTMPFLRSLSKTAVSAWPQNSTISIWSYTTLWQQNALMKTMLSMSCPMSRRDRACQARSEIVKMPCLRTSRQRRSRTSAKATNLSPWSLKRTYPTYPNKLISPKSRKSPPSHMSAHPLPSPRLPALFKPSVSPMTAFSPSSNTSSWMSTGLCAAAIWENTREIMIKTQAGRTTEYPRCKDT